MRSVCVFCGTSSGRDAEYAASAAQFGRLLAEEGIELVWGGGHVGLMGVVADAVLAAGGRTHGIIPAFMAERELAHPRTTELSVVEDMRVRKAAMTERADAFVALPGGFGTLDELFETVTGAQLQLHGKPVGLLNVKNFFDPLRAMLRHMSDEGFIKPGHLELLHVDANGARLLRSMRAHSAPRGDWLAGKIPAAAP